MKPLFRLSVLSVVLLLAPLVFAQQPASAPRAITIDDYFQIREVHDPQLSADAKWVSYTVKTAVLKDDKNEERIWTVPTAGGEGTALTAEGVSSSHARWSPDGKFIAFLSARNGGKTQVWLLNGLGGEAQRMTNTPKDVEDFAWSPDSRRLALVLRDASPEELEAAKERDEKDKGTSEKEKKPKTRKPWVIDRLQFKVDEVRRGRAGQGPPLQRQGGDMQPQDGEMPVRQAQGKNSPLREKGGGRRAGLGRRALQLHRVLRHSDCQAAAAEMGRNVLRPYNGAPKNGDGREWS